MQRFGGEKISGIRFEYLIIALCILNIFTRNILVHV